MTHLRLSHNDVETCCGLPLWKDMAAARSFKLDRDRWRANLEPTELNRRRNSGVTNSLRRCSCVPCLDWTIDWLVGESARRQRNAARRRLRA